MSSSSSSSGAALPPTAVEDRQLLERALAREPAACRQLVGLLTPVIQKRVNGALIRRRRISRQETLDLTQDVFRLLFDNDGRILRTWDPSRGLSLKNFVGLVAGREVNAILASGRRSAWAETPTAPDDLDPASEGGETERHTMSKDLLRLVVERLEQRLSPKGLQLFFDLFVHHKEVEAICAEQDMNRDAVYTWRARLKRTAQTIHDELMSDEDGPPPSSSVEVPG